MGRELPSDSADLASWMVATIAGFCASAQNSLGMPEEEPAFDAPLVGFAAGDDPLFEELKQHVGPSHWTPGEAFALASIVLSVSATSSAL